MTPEEHLLGGHLAERLALAQLANPGAFIGPETPRFCSSTQCRRNCAYLASGVSLSHSSGSGIAVTFIRVEGGNHGCWPAGEPYPSKPLPARIEHWMLTFLAKHLQGKPGFNLQGGHRIEVKEIDQTPTEYNHAYSLEQ